MRCRRAGRPHDALIDLPEPDARELGRHVGREVAGRVVELVEQLLLAGRRADQPAAPGPLHHQRLAGCLDLGDRVTDVGQVGDLFETGINLGTDQHTQQPPICPE